MNYIIKIITQTNGWWLFLISLISFLVIIPLGVTFFVYLGGILHIDMFYGFFIGFLSSLIIPFFIFWVKSNIIWYWKLYTLTGLIILVIITSLVILYFVFKDAFPAVGYY